MTVSQARVMLASLPDNSELVLSCCSPMYSQVRGFVVREANTYGDDMFWKSVKGQNPVGGVKINIIEVEFERSR